MQDESFNPSVEETSQDNIPKCGMPGCNIQQVDGSAPLLRCSACKVTYYCSKEHQRQHWSAHKKPCKAKRA